MAIEKKPSRRFVDVSVGQRFASRRRELGVGAQELADVLGLSLDELASRESGMRGFLAAEIYTAANFLGRTPNWFFHSLDIKVTEWPDD